MSEYIVELNSNAVSGNKFLLGTVYLDAMPVVRCRDCAYNAKDTDGICYRFEHEHFNQPDGFCAWGERRSDDR